MAKQTSREIALERRKALSTSGKKGGAINAGTPNRVRTAGDAMNSTRSNPSHTVRKKSSKQSKPKGMSTRNRNVNSVATTSRDISLARRQALSLKGKTADKSSDRTRVDVVKATSENKVDTSIPTTKNKIDNETTTNSPNFKKRTPKLSSRKKVERRANSKKRVIENSSRSFALARREALSKHGKSAGKQPTSAASVARQGNPDLTTREIAQRVRELRSKSGATGGKRTAVKRPCGPNKHGAKQSAMAADAHWKVGVSETTSGQKVTGTQANRSVKTTGNEASTCRSITGTQYLGSEVFDAFCQTAPINSHPRKVRVTNTTHGNVVTGNEVGRSEKVTGDEPGTCKSLTGTEYISANQSNNYCGGVKPNPLKVGESKTIDGRKVTGSMVGRSKQVTGDEAGTNLELTGDQYLGADNLPPGRPAQKVGSVNTLRGAGVTGTDVARSELVTGNEPGSCKFVTGDEYIGTQQYQTFCGSKPKSEAPKVGLSLTNKSQGVSGTLTGRSEKVTGDEPGTCKAITGTPYAGLEQSGQWCDGNIQSEIQKRTPRRVGTPGARLTGQQPGIGGVMTGAERGACEPLTGTPYVGSDQLRDTCGKIATSAMDELNSNSGSEPWQSFSVKSPARSAQLEREISSSVTGTSYENGNRITGPFDMAPDKVTGTEQFRFDYKLTQRGGVENPAETDKKESTRPTSRITGEGQSSGLNITGDDWARGERVTGTEGVSARRRNPTRPGPMTAVPSLNEPKRNEELAKPDFLITGSSGNTRDGQLVTFSGGARG